MSASSPLPSAQVCVRVGLFSLPPFAKPGRLRGRRGRRRRRRPILGLFGLLASELVFTVQLAEHIRSGRPPRLFGSPRQIADGRAFIRQRRKGAVARRASGVRPLLWRTSDGALRGYVGRRNIRGYCRTGMRRLRHRHECTVGNVIRLAVKRVGQLVCRNELRSAQWLEETHLTYCFLV